jgi:hypothetical protein
MTGYASKFCRSRIETLPTVPGRDVMLLGPAG